MSKKFPKEVPDFCLKPRHIKMLKFARKSIKSTNHDLVCSAIEFAVRNKEVSGLNCSHEKAVAAMHDLKNFIRRAIERKLYFHDWQRESCGISRTPVEQRQDRIDWIDYILENATYAD